MNDLTNEQKAFLEQFLVDNFIPIRTINLHHTAYGLKQKFSRLHFYITTEQFISAMRSAGFKAQMMRDGNARFNISQDSPYFYRTLD